MVTSFWHPDGTPMSAQQFMEALFGRLPEFFKDDAELRGTDLGLHLKSSLHSIPGFKKSGKYTFRLHLNPETLASAQQSLGAVWKVAEVLQSMQALA
jgi:hypothetical protein